MLLGDPTNTHFSPDELDRMLINYERLTEKEQLFSDIPARLGVDFSLDETAGILSPLTARSKFWQSVARFWADDLTILDANDSTQTIVTKNLLGGRFELQDEIVSAFITGRWYNLYLALRDLLNVPSGLTRVVQFSRGTVSERRIDPFRLRDQWQRQGLLLESGSRIFLSRR